MQGGQIGAPIGNSVPSEAASSRLTVSQRASPYLRSHATKGLSASRGGEKVDRANYLVARSAMPS
jgi:hypothetical protein